MSELYYSHAIRQALEEEMRRDERVILLGEDIAEYGGAFKLTAGIAQTFGKERVRNTPIAENGFIGVAIGAALTGLRPVVEIMFMDFITLAMDQLVNHASKFRYQYGEQAAVPLVVRCPAGAGRCYGPTHSQSLERYFFSTPGLLVVCPSTPYDAKGLLKAAIRCDDPVIFVESKVLYGTRGEVPEQEYLVPLGKAVMRRAGRDVTLVAYSRMVGEALRAAQALEERGYSAAVIDLRTLAPLDMELVASSVTDTGRAVVVEEGWLTGGIGAEVVARITEGCFDCLQAPVRRVAAADVPVPCAPALEGAATPNGEDIARAALEVIAY
ncbi:MAG: alpha-ketoacid dehydrogenase subunit beta [Candidatus Zipacnadales bacterium]